MITLLNRQGKEIQEQDKIMERIEEFYSELYDSDQAVTIRTDPEEVPSIMAWEVEAALRKMKNGKEAGKDQVKIETRGWLEENKLSIHLGKTESILTASKIRLARTDSLKISCGSVGIESKSKITYLGLTFDNDMSFSSMGNSVIKIVNAKLKFLYRKSAFFGTNEKKLLCSALVNPHFEYACNAWYRSVNAKVKHKLQTAQNKMIRYLLNYGCRRHIGFSDFKKSNCLDINARVDYMSLNLMFNIFNNVAPSYMCDINRISHRHHTRQSDSAFVVPGVKGQGSKSFKFNGSKLWNELPTNLKHVQQNNRFKKECKALLMTRMKEKVEMNVVP